MAGGIQVYESPKAVTNSSSSRGGDPGPCQGQQVAGSIANDGVTFKTSKRLLCE